MRTSAEIFCEDACCLGRDRVDEDDELRRRAFDERRPVTAIVRETVRAYLGTEE